MAKGYGLAIVIQIPESNYDPQIRTVSLDDFPRVPFGVLWQGVQTPVLFHFLKVVQAAATRFTAKVSN